MRHTRRICNDHTLIARFHVISKKKKLNELLKKMEKKTVLSATTTSKQCITIYVLELQNKHFYIGKTLRDACKRIQEHKRSTNPFVKKFSPIVNTQIFENCDDFDEDKYTKMYMKTYGIANVRGGSYCDIALNLNVKTQLEKEMATCQNLCFRCKAPGHFIDSCPYELARQQDLKDVDQFVESILGKPRARARARTYRKKRKSWF